MAYDMFEFNGVRYRFEDAIRLGLMSKDTAVSAHNVTVDAKLEREHKAPAGLLTSAVLNPAGDGDGEKQDPEKQADSTGDNPDADKQAAADADRPHNGQSKKIWIEYALGVGFTAEELEGLGRDQIVEAVDARQAAGEKE